MKSLLLALLFLFSIYTAQAQSAISGTITDSISKVPIGYVTISAADTRTGKIVNGTISDEQGKFLVEDLPAGTYRLNIDFIGYRKKVLPDVTISNNKVTIALGTIAITPAGNALSEVVVTATTPLVENKIDKIVYNAANDVTAQGGVAIDILRKVPQVSVDVDGNVELQGNANVRFLINGKPSTVFGNSLTDVLASIPASQIKSIEVLTSPGARYDAQGTAGIINILLKDNKAYGFNGSINLSAGTLLENASLNLNYRHNTWGLSAFFSGNDRLQARTYTSQDRRSHDSLLTVTDQLLQNGYADFKRYGYQSGLNFDWDISGKDNLGASFGYSAYANTNEGITSISEQTIDQSTSHINKVASIRDAYNRSLVNAYDWSLSYRRNFNKKGQQLFFLYTGSYGTPSANFRQAQSLAGAPIPYAGTQSTNPGTDQETNISLDYTQPVGSSVTLEAGGKLTLQDLNSDITVNTFNITSGSYLPAPDQSYLLDYTRKVYAGYVSAAYSLFRFLDVRMGARMEHTDTHLNTSNTAIPAYDNLVPSITLAHSFGIHTIKLSYARRLERPDYRDINPFLNRSDPYNISTGNPTLLPEIGDNVEAGYFVNKNGASLNFTVFERYNTQDIKPYTIFYPAYQIGDSIYRNVSINTRVNIGAEYNTGVSISGSVPLTKALKLTGNIMAANRHIIDQINNKTVNSFGYRVNATASYQLPMDLIVEGFFQYRSPFNNIQGKMPQSLAYTFALRKQLAHKKWSIGLTTTNPFNKYIRELSTVNTPYYDAVNFRKIPYRSFGISISYKFGKLEYKKVKEEDNDALNNAATQDAQ